LGAAGRRHRGGGRVGADLRRQLRLHLPGGGTVTMRRAFMLAALPLLLATPARAQHSVYQPGIDVLDYAFTLDLPDTGAFLRADVTLAVRREPRVSSLALDLVQG